MYMLGDRAKELVLWKRIGPGVTVDVHTFTYCEPETDERVQKRRTADAPLAFLVQNKNFRRLTVVELGRGASCSCKNFLIVRNTHGYILWSTHDVSE